MNVPQSLNPPVPAQQTAAAPLLDVRDLQTFFFTGRGVARAVDGVSFHVDEGEVVGLVGESGCGKSVTALSILRLIPSPPGRIVGGEAWFDGRDLLSLSNDEMQTIRGNRISMIFQEPMTALNPVFRVDEQVMEVIRQHRRIGRGEARERTIELLREVGIPSPEVRMKDYPHQMSGGMRQRVMIAMALACGPRLILADEPTTALDVTIQAQILDLLREARERTETSLLLITHDLGVIAEMAHRVVVMYTGRVVEEASVTELFTTPLHPYTQGLMKSIPGIVGVEAGDRLEAIRGVVPSLFALPPGCKFNTRCPHAFDRCFKEEPWLILPEGGHPVRCWLYRDKVNGEGEEDTNRRPGEGRRGDAGTLLSPHSSPLSRRNGNGVRPCERLPLPASACLRIPDSTGLVRKEAGHV